MERSACGNVGVRAWPHAVISSLGARARGGVVRPRRSVSHVVRPGQGVGPKIGRKFTKISQKLSKSPKVKMLKFGDVSFDLGFERGRMSATGYVAKISMLRLIIGSGRLRLSSCMLSIGRGPKCEQGKGGGLPPLALFAFGSEANAEHA